MSAASLGIDRPLYVGLLACCLVHLAHGQSAPPPMTSVRHDEDYSYLSDDARRRAWWEHLKYVPIDDTDWRWTLGAEVRIRYENYQNDLWGEGPDADHDYVWSRALPWVELRHGDDFRAFVQLISAFEEGDEADTSPVDEDRADFLQAFADVRLTPESSDTALTLRGGRQVLSFGSERLISARYKPNVLRSFDAATLVMKEDAWIVNALVGRPVEVERGEFDDEADESRALWMLYATHETGLKQGLDIYYIGYENDEATYDQGSARESRHTVGSRIFGGGSGWDWNFELFGQAGTFGDGDIRAWSVASDTGVVLENLPLAPRLGLKANIISGDHDPDDADLETFNPLFPKGRYFGEAGLIGPYNLINVHPSLEFDLSERWSLSMASVVYWRESTDDGVYDSAGNVLRADSGSDERFIGSQYDAVIGYAANRLLDASLAYSVFVPGGFIESTGPDETVHFLGVEVRFRF